MKWIAGLLILFGVGSARADVLHLATGQDVRGKVVAYANMAFDVENDGGAITKYQSALVRRVEFEARPAPAKLETRNKGTVEGNVTAFENAMFVVQRSGDQSEKIAAMFVTSADFGGASAKKVDHIPKGTSLDLAKHIVPGKVTVVDFYASWCGPCRMIAPYLEGLAKQDNDVVLRKVNIDENRPLAQKYTVTAIPFIMIYDRAGNLVGSVRGANQMQVQTYVKKAKAGTVSAK